MFTNKQSDIEAGKCKNRDQSRQRIYQGGVKLTGESWQTGKLMGESPIKTYRWISTLQTRRLSDESLDKQALQNCLGN